VSTVKLLRVQSAASRPSVLSSSLLHVCYTGECTNVILEIATNYHSSLHHLAEMFLSQMGLDVEWYRALGDERPQAKRGPRHPECNTRSKNLIASYPACLIRDSSPAETYSAKRETDNLRAAQSESRMISFHYCRD
jgi:hypothetical protein